MSLDQKGSITLYPDRRAAISTIVVALGLAGLGAWLAWGGSATIAGISAVVGALLLIGAMAWLIPSRAYLHLSERGLIYCTFFNPKRVDWVDVDRFAVAPVSGAAQVVWDYASHYPADLLTRQRNKKEIGYEAILPALLPVERRAPGPPAQPAEA